MAQAQPAESFSLVLGGPLYQALLRLRLATPPIAHVERRIAAAVVITWVPVVLLCLLAGTAFGGVKIDFLHDIDAHVRLLVALPLLLVAEPLVHEQLARAVRQFVERGVVAPADRDRFAAIVKDTMRLRNSMLIELVILAAALGAGPWIWREQFASRVGAWYMVGDELTAAGAWYAFVSLGLFRFVLFRWYFRLALWYFFLWRVSRLPLRLNALHPDRAGGIGFLAGSLTALAPILIAQSATIAGAIAGSLLHEGLELPQFRLEIGAAVVLLVALAVVPLVFFMPALFAAAIQAKRDYGVLGMRYVDDFRDKWMRTNRAGSEPLVGSGDIQSLADLAVAHDRIQQMGVLPVDLRAVVRFALVVAVPFLPLALFVIPLNELVTRLVKQLL
jgi:hypothetical protein